MTDTSQYFRCSCGSEVINLDWLDADKRGLCVSVFDQRISRSLWWKLKTCWRVLREGSPWGDQAILQEDELKRLSSFFEAYGRRMRREREQAEKQCKKIRFLKKQIIDGIATNQANSADIRRRINDLLGDTPVE